MRKISGLVNAEALRYNGIMSDNIEEKEWPNTVRNRDELDSALEAGLASGVSDLSWEEIIEEAKRESAAEKRETIQ